MNPQVILSLFHLLSNPNSLQRHAFAKKFVETFEGCDFVMMDRIETNKKASTLAAKFAVSLLDEGNALKPTLLPENRATAVQACLSLFSTLHLYHPCQDS
jgi:hypothetical protein